MHLLGRPQPTPAFPSQPYPCPHNPIDTPAAPPVLTARAPMVIDLTRDTHRVPYSYATEMCAEVMRSGRVYRPPAPVVRLSHLEPAVPPPSTQPTATPPSGLPPVPTTLELATKTTPPIAKKGQPKADITVQLKKVRADISIWDLIHTSSKHHEAFLHVFQVAHMS